MHGLVRPHPGVLRKHLSPAYIALPSADSTLNSPTPLKRVKRNQQQTTTLGKGFKYPRSHHGHIPKDPPPTRRAGEHASGFLPTGHAVNFEPLPDLPKRPGRVPDRVSKPRAARAAASSRRSNGEEVTPESSDLPRSVTAKGSYYAQSIALPEGTPVGHYISGELSGKAEEIASPVRQPPRTSSLFLCLVQTKDIKKCFPWTHRAIGNPSVHPALGNSSHTGAPSRGPAPGTRLL